MNFDCDVVIIGAGPVGSTIAYYLSQNNLKVTIVEKKKEVGYPLQCAGILSKNIFDYNILPDSVILNKVNGAFLHTKKHILNVKKDESVAYIIDRIAYDNFLLNRAVDSGVKLINQKAVDFDIENGVTYLLNNDEISSKIIIGCDGYNSKLSKKLGNTQKNFMASQVLAEIDLKSMFEFRNSSQIDNHVDTYLLKDALPGFIWIIPLKNNLYRVGLFSNQDYKKQSELLTEFLDKNFNYSIIEKYRGFIPVYDDKNQIVKNRALLIGDAAGQIKPTSGGGLLIGFDACRMACKYVVEAISQDNIDILKKYQKEFNKNYQKEFNYQFKVHKTLNLLNDEDLNYLFLKLKENDCETLISTYGDMDTQSTLVKEFIKRGLIFKIIPSFLFKKVIKIFGFR